MYLNIDTLKFAKCTRNDLLEVIHPHTFSSLGNKLSSEFIEVFDYEIGLVFDTLPNGNFSLCALYVQPTKKKEILAWLATYSFQEVPVTSRMLILTSTDLKEYLFRNSDVYQNEQFIWMQVGIILGELLELYNLNIIDDINFLQAETTYSFAFSKALNLGIDSKFGYILNSINVVKELYSQKNNFSIQRSVFSLWANYLEFIGVLRENRWAVDFLYFPIIDALNSLIAGKRITASQFSSILRMHIADEMLPKTTDTMEHRIATMELLANEIVAKSNLIHPQSAAFTIAALINEISPGSFKYTRIIKKFSKSVSGCFAWYGFCSSISAKAATSNFGNGLGGLLYKNLSLIKYDPFIECDISYDELEMLFIENQGKLDSLKNNFIKDYLYVQLLPRLKTIVNIRKPIPVKQNNQNYELPSLTKDDLNQMKKAVVTLNELGIKLASMIGGDSTPGLQTELFPVPSKQKVKKSNRLK